MTRCKGCVCLCAAWIYLLLPFLLMQDPPMEHLLWWGQVGEWQHVLLSPFTFIFCQSYPPPPCSHSKITCAASCDRESWKSPLDKEVNIPLFKNKSPRPDLTYLDLHQQIAVGHLHGSGCQIWEGALIQQTLLLPKLPPSQTQSGLQHVTRSIPPLPLPCHVTVPWSIITFNFMVLLHKINKKNLPVYYLVKNWCWPSSIIVILPFQYLRLPP